LRSHGHWKQIRSMVEVGEIIITLEHERNKDHLTKTLASCLT
jgi:hypothetical protein